ncbi:gliding motility-associated C-terminal domain-containing protein [Flavobacteriaceae bacterium S356]|uniref:Gliding motility-associated C-terminal domain-containing protein n=1 Tax=Asprobacillus argus TaxID=3076534 RepID=A0ABU3LHB5_9FLAO|nr:gliding motility-associated C-terminal domain-containing protein [Flavobacteriaceae bacterium S356]
MRVFLLLLAFSCFLETKGQDVQLFKQFGGRIDFTMIGNTLNTAENGFFSPCVINTVSSATLTLQPTDTIRAAYLYWAGSGAGDFQVRLNDSIINSTRVFRDTLQPQNLEFFSAFAEVTDQIKEEGNTTYTLSEFDLTSVIPTYCPNGTNFGGWAIVIVYKDDTLPLNQVNVYDGLQHVPTALTIQLNNLNVIDNDDAKIGFVAWEGDAGLSVNESLRVNGNLISNPPLNPATNAFNGTNSFTNQSGVFNMDIDFYNIQNNIAIGDNSATVSLTSGQDFVMVNTIVTKLNSQLPDATVTIDNVTITNCNDRIVDVDFTIHNQNSTDALPINTEVTVYINDALTESLSTLNEIPIGGSESRTITLTIPENVLPDFDIRIVVDEQDLILESDENNNVDVESINYPPPPDIIQLNSITVCNKGFDTGDFDLTQTADFLRQQYASDVVFRWYPSQDDLMNDTNEIDPSFTYNNISRPQTIYIKTEHSATGCFSINTMILEIENCPPTVYNLFSPNGDGANEEFVIEGLKNVYVNYQLRIYNRYGSLVYRGNNDTPNWKGTHLNTNKRLPEGTYFYALELNDTVNKPITGWVYLNR